MKHDQERLIQENQWMSLTRAMRLQHIQESNKITTLIPQAVALEEIKKITKEIQHIGENDSHIDQLSIHLQDFKNKLVSHTEEKTKESQLENFQIENLDDKIEGKQEFENVDLEIVSSEEKSN